MSLGVGIVKTLAESGFVSGQSLADQFGVSRAAINHHVKRLVEQGVEIHRVKGKGYRLGVPLSPLDVDRITTFFRQHSPDFVPEFHVLEETESTNTFLRQHLVGGGAWLDACFAESQTAGRGRLGRKWLSVPYQSVLMSVAHELEGGPSASAGLSLAVGLAIVRALDESGFPGCRLKWPNDLIFDGRKLGGILIEITGELGGSCISIIGIGLNLHLPATMAKQCGQPVIDLQSACNRFIDRNLLASQMLSHLLNVLSKFSRTGFAPFVDEWQQRHAHRGRLIKVTRGRDVLEGMALGVDEGGALRLRDSSSRVHRITTGEVMA